MGVGSGGSNVGKEEAAENLGRVGLAYAEESALELDVLPIELVPVSVPFRQDSQKYLVSNDLNKTIRRADVAVRRQCHKKIGIILERDTPNHLVRVKRNQQLVLTKHPKQSELDLSRERCLPCV